MIARCLINQRQMNVSGQVLRLGATMAECALTLPVLLLVLFALLDLGIAATRYNALAEVARRIARETILHGSSAPSDIGAWGTSEFNGTVGDASPIVVVARDMVPTMKAADVRVRVSWPDGDNSPRDRVQVHVQYDHVPLVPAICPWGTLPLESVATMHIVN